MSLIDKSIDFDSTITGLTNAVYSVVKQIFTNSSLDTINNFIYFDTDKKNGIGFSSDNSYMKVIYKINNNTYEYKYLRQNTFSKLYYNISKNKDMIALSLISGVLSFGVGYEDKIGFWGFFIGAISDSYLTQSARLLIKDSYIYKSQYSSTNYASTRWLSSKGEIVNSLIQVPLIITSGNFSSLFEIFSCNNKEVFNLSEIIYSSNKYYRLLYSEDLYESSGGPYKGDNRSVILAMEVADD